MDLYRIESAIDSSQALGTSQGYLQLKPYSAQDPNFLWRFSVSAGLFLIHNQSGGVCVFPDGRGSGVAVTSADLSNPQFSVTFDALDGGWIAVNNRQRNLVFDVNQSFFGPVANVYPVNGYPWNGGTNQMWRFVRMSSD